MAIKTPPSFLHPCPDPLSRLRTALEPIELRAQYLPWYTERPWLAARAVRLEDGHLAVDLHGLTIELAQDAITTVFTLSEIGALVRLIHGRGSHSAPGLTIRGLVRQTAAVEEGRGSLRVEHKAEGHLDLVWRGGNRSWA